MVFLRSAALIAACAVSLVSAVDISVQATGGNKTRAYQYGFLHEDINNSGDGGLYAELIRNRAFQYGEKFPASLEAWFPVNGANISISHPKPALSDELPAAINVKSSGKRGGQIGFANEGYWGINVKKQKYSGSFWVKGTYKGQFTASLQSALTDEVFASTKIKSKAVADEWVEHKLELIPKKDAPNSNNTFAITFNAAGAKDGSLDFNLISLFPPTYKGRKNGMRIDIAEALEELHPTFFRFPGGNMLEGDNIDNWWDWKDTLGPLRHRKGFQNTWGYQMTNGFGLLEYLEFAEDMNMEMILGVYSGLSLDGNVVPEDELQPWIDDALNQIEFVRGDANSTWGSKRAELGHPEPFKLEFVEIGNEEWLAGYPHGWETYKQYRLPMFMDAIRAAYPDINIIASGSVFDQNGIDIPEPAIGDYHPYRKPDNFLEEFNLFDNVATPHIIGEVSSTHVNGGIGWEGQLAKWPWWIGSVGGAIGLISYERNADRILGILYAPILRNLERSQWDITILQHAADPALTTRSTDWYIWELMAAHPIIETLPVKGELDPLFFVAGKTKQDSLVWKGACYNTTEHANVPVTVSFEGVAAGTQAELTLLTGPKDPYGYNDPKTGINVVETTKTILEAGEDGEFEFEMPELSVAVLDTYFEDTYSE
ncbi:related to alpha-L-arabinofuranosidase A precursor [Cephalotrichum gorgonifer]|uniref:non-reducing end alpha-L-arabinofuranosidase n=1 Tax=Cephalotrichum gorgonifer TaxID=2041049 RepID=A0AAE8SZG6_9PEZI|nr:related to alpha-L-arabinofuranosidase A precursor [Cephalotrichum gorgonifer]